LFENTYYPLGPFMAQTMPLEFVEPAFKSFSFYCVCVCGRIAVSMTACHGSLPLIKNLNSIMEYYSIYDVVAILSNLFSLLILVNIDTDKLSRFI
jgi:hypothetical protein